MYHLQPITSTTATTAIPTYTLQQPPSFQETIESPNSLTTSTTSNSSLSTTVTSSTDMSLMAANPMFEDYDDDVKSNIRFGLNQATMTTNLHDAISNAHITPNHQKPKIYDTFGRVS